MFFVVVENGNLKYGMTVPYYYVDLMGRKEKTKIRKEHSETIVCA